jgi:uncharacterized repeat protein (TIGR01451 family)
MLFFANVVFAQELKLEKAGPKLQFLHRTVVFTITISNPGGEAAEGVRVREILPDQLDYVMSTPKGMFKPRYEENPASITWQLNIPAETKQEITLTLRAMTKGFCQSSTELSYRERATKAISNLTIRGVPAIHIGTYDTEDPVVVGGETMYVIDIRSEGTAPCTNIKIVSKIRGEMEFVSASVPASFKREKGDVIFDPVPILMPGDKLTYKITVRAVQAGSTKHTTILWWDEGGEIVNEEGTTMLPAKGPGPAMSIIQYDTEDPIELGKNTIYVIQVKNEGSDVCTTVKLESQLSEELEFISASGPSVYKNENGKVVFEAMAQLSPGEQLTYKIVAKGVKAGSAKNKATIVYNEFTHPIIVEEGTSVYK